MSGSSNSPRRQAGTSTAIDIAAANAFFEKGFAETSIQDLADHLRMPKGSVFYHVGSKEELLYEVLVTGAENLLKRLTEISAHPISVADRLRIWIRDVAQSSIEDAKNGLVFARTQYLQFLTPEHRAHYNAIRDQYAAAFVGLLDEGVRRGELRDVNTKIVAFGIISMTGNLRTWFDPNGPLRPVDVAEIWWDFLTQGLLDTRPS